MTQSQQSCLLHCHSRFTFQSPFAIIGQRRTHTHTHTHTYTRACVHTHTYTHAHGRTISSYAARLRGLSSRVHMLSSCTQQLLMLYTVVHTTNDIDCTRNQSVRRCDSSLAVAPRGVDTRWVSIQSSVASSRAAMPRRVENPDFLIKCRWSCWFYNGGCGRTCVATSCSVSAVPRTIRCHY